MKFILIAEGKTEEALGRFLAKWLNSQLTQNVGVRIVRFVGAADAIKETPTTAKGNLKDDKKDIIAVICLLDWHGLPPSVPKIQGTLAERYAHAQQHLEKQVNHPRFKQHFAVHETEAWLLSQPSIFPAAVAKELQDKVPRPEEVNNQEPPSKLLSRHYSTKMPKGYIKPVDGNNLFAKLDPNIAYDKCPHLKALLDDMLALAEAQV